MALAGLNPRAENDLRLAPLTEFRAPSKLPLGGGTTYDAVIAHSTWSAGATVLLTWNVDDFLRVAPLGLDVATPEEYLARPSRVR